MARGTTTGWFRRAAGVVLAVATAVGTTTTFGPIPSSVHAEEPVDGLRTAGFGTDGVAVDPIAGAEGRTVLTFDVLDLPDGSLLVGGAFAKPNGNGELGFVVKYRANGTRDTSFGIGGRVALPAGNVSEPVALAALPDGRIVVGGRFFGARLPTNGGLFLMAADGSTLEMIGTYPANRDSTPTNRLIPQPDGSVIAVGAEIRVVLPNGRLDPSRERPVPLFSYLGSSTSSGARLADGRTAVMTTVDVIVENVSRKRCSVALFDRNGVLDTSFGAGGRVEIVVGTTAPQSCWQLLAEPSGSMLVVVGDPKSNNTAGVRLDAHGQVQVAPTLAVPTPALGHEFAVEGTGRLLVARSTTTTTVEARRPDGSVDPTFAGGAPAVINSAMVKPQTFALQGGGILVVAGEAPSTIVLARLDSVRGIAPQPTVLATTKLVPIAPFRFLDTREGIGALRTPIAAGQVIDVQIGGAHTVPFDARAVVMSVAATGGTEPGFVTAWPSGTPRPTVASLNIERPGQTVANLVTVKLGSTGAVSLFSLGQTELIADVQGYYVQSDAAPDGRFVPALPPQRLVDTRVGRGAPLGPVAADGQIDVQITGATPVPPTGVSAVALNVAATEVPLDGFVTVFPTGTGRPFVSSLNVAAGETRSNMVIVPVGVGGRVSIYSFGGAHIVVDVAGWFTDSSAVSSTSGLYVPISPARIVDTRLGATAPLAPDTTFSRLIGGSLLAPPRSRTSAIVVNLTATETTGPGFFALWPHGLARPLVANLNAGAAGQTVPNAAIVPIRQEMIDGYTQSGAHLVIDVFGYYLA